MEGDVAADQVTAVGEAVGKAGGLRQEQQPGGLDRAARQDEHVRLLLHGVPVGVDVDRRPDPAPAVQQELADVATPAAGRSDRWPPRPG